MIFSFSQLGPRIIIFHINLSLQFTAELSSKKQTHPGQCHLLFTTDKRYCTKTLKVLESLYLVTSWTIKRNWHEESVLQLVSPQHSPRNSLKVLAAGPTLGDCTGHALITGQRGVLRLQGITWEWVEHCESSVCPRIVLPGGWKYNKVQIAAEWSCLHFAMLHRPAVTLNGITLLLTSPGAVCIVASSPHMYRSRGRGCPRHQGWVIPLALLRGCGMRSGWSRKHKQEESQPPLLHN